MPVAAALDGLAGVLRTLHGQTADPAAVDRARDAVRTLVAEVRRTPATTEDDHFVVSSVVEDIRRSLRTLQPEGDGLQPAAR